MQSTVTTALNSIPATRPMKKGSKASVSAGRAKTSPHAFTRDPCSARAALLGMEPTSFAIDKILYA